MEEGVFIDNLKIYKKSDDTFDSFLEINENKSSNNIYEIAFDRKEVNIDLDNIQLNFFTVKDDISEYPKYYIRKIKNIFIKKI